MTGVPLAILLILQCSSSTRFKRQILNYKELEKNGLYLNVWILKEDISAGEKVTRSHLEKKKIWVSELDFIDIVIDMHQVIGKKVKTALKKGTLMQSDQFHQKNKKKNAEK